MKKHGFTLVELLVTIVIIALLGGVGIISFTTLFGTSEDKYYNSLESSVLLAGNDYFLDHRDELPTENHVKEVPITKLVAEKYLEPLKKSNGEACTEGKVYVYKENSKYKYEACILCDEDHISDGKYCSGEKSNEIIISAETVSGKSYDVSLNYDSTLYSKENIKVKISLKNENINVSKYEVKNTKTGVELPCSITGNVCETTVGTSGTYQVKAKVGDNAIASKYFNVRIAKNGPRFTVTKEGDIEPLTCTNNDTTRKVTFKITKDNINEEYRSILYEIYRKEYNETTGEQDLIKVKSGNENNLIRGVNGKEYYIKEDLGSGSYQLVVTITNFAGEVANNDPLVEFDVSYYAHVEFTDNDYAGLSDKHEVVYGQIYDYKKELPTEKKAYNINNLDIRWYRDNVRITGDTKVTNTCTHTIVGKMPIPVQKEDFKNYCKVVVYNGAPQNLTESEPEHVTFKNKWQTNVIHDTLYASIDSNDYVWSDGTYDDKPFDCPMSKKSVTVKADDQSKTYNRIALAADDTCTLLDGVSGHIAKCSNNSGTITNVGTADKTLGNVIITSNGTDVTNNYEITKQKGTLKINSKPLTASLSGCGKTYDGGTSAPCTITYTNVESGDSVTGTATCTFDNKNVGTNKKVTCSSFTKSGTGNGNYTVPGNQTTTGTISALTLTASLSGCGKTYDGGTSASCTITYSNVKSGDSVTGTATCTYADKNVETNKTVTCSSFTKSGTGNGNYTVPGNQTTTGTISALTLTASLSGCGKTYDGGTSAPCTITYSNVKSGDSVTGTATCTYADKNVGTGKTVTCSSFTKSGTGNGNYSVPSGNKTTTGTISALTLTASLSGCGKTYNGNTTAPCTITYSNVKSGDSVTGTATCTYADANVGTNKPVTCTSFTKSGTGNGNYSVPSGNKTTTGTISAALLTCPGSATYTYSGSPITSSISCPGGSSRGGTITGTNAGEYTQNCTADGNHYFSSSCSTKWYIGRKGVAFPTCTSQAYTGQSVTLFEAHTAGEYTNSAITGTNVNTYSGNLTPTANYQWSSGQNVTSARSLSCSITGCNRWEKSGSSWIYYNTSCNKVISNWVYTGSGYVDPDSEGAKYWYHTDSSGIMQTGWIQYNSCWFYLDSSSGIMWANKSNVYVPGYSGTFSFNSDGYCYSGSGCSSSCNGSSSSNCCPKGGSKVAAGKCCWGSAAGAVNDTQCRSSGGTWVNNTCYASCYTPSC